jgi:hypothetical protein
VLLPPQPLQCPAGHDLEAKVVHELPRKIAIWRSLSQVTCDRCDAPITSDDARYTCKICSYDLCLECSQQVHQSEGHGRALTRGASCPTLTAMACHVTCGDLALCGPDDWGIHHVVVLRGAMLPDPDAARLMHMPPHFDVFSCPTIESNRHLKGERFVWYAATSLYARDQRTGQMFLVGDVPEGSRIIEVAQKHVPVKLLLHPLRRGHGGPAIVPALFERAVMDLAINSTHWSLRTALNAITSSRTALDPADYPTPNDREQLMDELEQSWESRPICSAAAVCIWQRYFQLFSEQTGPPSTAKDRAAQLILQWIPMIPDQTMPSLLVKVLTRCRWILKGSLA